MFKVEFIYKESVYDDIIENWRRLHKPDLSENSAGFVFEVESHPLINNGVIQIMEDDSMYIYNISDFYRIKITQGA